MSKPTLKRIKEKMTSTVEQYEAGMAQFQARIANDPVHAFTWADTIMSLTARMYVAKHWLSSIAAWEAADPKEEGQPKNDEEAVDFIHSAILREALRKNRFTEQSTSQCSNLMKREDAAFYAELADEWRFL